MKSISKSYIIPTGLAIFSMLFGAGNLVYPLIIGTQSGDQTVIGLTGFLLTAVFLPVAGLVAVMLFDGDYQAFFQRMGKKTGNLLIFLCMLVLGPILVIPRIVTVSHSMIASFLPWTFLQTINPASSFVFALIFLGITFLATFRENKIVEVLGKYISPALLISLAAIIIKGMLSADHIATNNTPALTIFARSLTIGYETLDLLGTIFFGSVIITMLRGLVDKKTAANRHKLALIGLKAGVLGTALLGAVYVGMSFLGAYYGHGLGKAELFREIAFRVMGAPGAAVVGIAVLMACFSTSIALGAVTGEYLQRTIFNNKVGFVTSLLIALSACLPLSTFGLEYVLELTGGPLTYIGYPVIIAITFCNIAYKTIGFKPIKLPVLLTFCAAVISYIW